MAQYNSVEDLVRGGYYGYQGWQTPEALADFAATGGAGKGGPTSGGGIPGATTNYADIAQQMLQLQKQAAQPAIQSLEASRPEVSQRYAETEAYLKGKEDPLKARYDALIEDIKGREKRELQRSEIGLEKEWGRRGLSALGGAYEETLGERQQPISRDYASLLKEAGISREESLADLMQMVTGLTGQQTAEQRAISNAIAQLQAGGASDAVTNALQMYQLQQQAGQSAQQLAWQKEQAAKEQEWAEKEWPYKERTYEYALNKPYYKSTSSNYNDPLGLFS